MRVHACMYACTCVRVHTRVCVHACAHVCVYQCRCCGHDHSFAINIVTTMLIIVTNINTIIIITTDLNICNVNTYLETIEICKKFFILVIKITFNPHNKFEVTCMTNINSVLNIQGFRFLVIGVIYSYPVYNILKSS